MSVPRRRLAGWTKSLLALVLALTVFRVIERVLAPSAPETLGPEPAPDLRRWDYVGCYELHVEPWHFGRYVASSDSASLALLTPPGRVMLLPDSLDEWGRGRGTLRATPLSGDHDPSLARTFHWFVRVDTLWLLWAAGATRAGVALFADGDSLVGRALALRADSAQGAAVAGAWRINCSTFERDRAMVRPRR